MAKIIASLFIVFHDAIQRAARREKRITASLLLLARRSVAAQPEPAPPRNAG